MKEQLISLDTAKLAKEKGFNLFSQGWYGCDDPVHGEPNKLFVRTYSTWEEFGEEDSQEGTEIYSAPTQNMLQKWLRDEHRLLVDACHADDFPWWKCKITILNVDEELINTEGIIVYVKTFMEFNSYEDALETGLEEALKLIKVWKMN